MDLPSANGLTAVSMRIEGRTDNWGAAAIRFRASNFFNWASSKISSQDCKGNTLAPGEQFDGEWGDFTSYGACPANTVITGLKTQASSGNFGVISAKFYCQYVPNNNNVKSCYNFWENYKMTDLKLICRIGFRIDFWEDKCIYVTGYRFLLVRENFSGIFLL